MPLGKLWDLILVALEPLEHNFGTLPPLGMDLDGFRNLLRYLDAQMELWGVTWRAFLGFRHIWRAGVGN
mgnify:CR=1 FL=1